MVQLGNVPGASAGLLHCYKPEGVGAHGKGGGLLYGEGGKNGTAMQALVQDCKRSSQCLDVESGHSVSAATPPLTLLLGVGASPRAAGRYRHHALGNDGGNLTGVGVHL